MYKNAGHFMPVNSCMMGIATVRKKYCSCFMACK